MEKGKFPKDTVDPGQRQFSVEPQSRCTLEKEIKSVGQLGRGRRVSVYDPVRPEEPNKISKKWDHRDSTCSMLALHTTNVSSLIPSIQYEPLSNVRCNPKTKGGGKQAIWGQRDSMIV